jgi:hypothetical protein
MSTRIQVASPLDPGVPTVIVSGRSGASRYGLWSSMCGFSSGAASAVQACS